MSRHRKESPEDHFKNNCAFPPSQQPQEDREVLEAGGPRRAPFCALRKCRKMVSFPLSSLLMVSTGPLPLALIPRFSSSLLFLLFFFQLTLRRERRGPSPLCCGYPCAISKPTSEHNVTCFQGTVCLSGFFLFHSPALVIKLRFL